MISAIIVAAGSSQRMGFDKLEADLAGLSVLARSILAFQECADVSEIRVVSPKDKVTAVGQLAEEIGADKFIEAVAGGAERHLSVWNGIRKLENSRAGLIAVHDGARPLVSPAAISACGEVASQWGAASLAHRVTDTLKRGNAAGEVCGSVSRRNLWAMETPQIFDFGLLREAYEKIMEEGRKVSDEASALQAIGIKVRLVENHDPNIKVTVPADLAIAERVLQNKAEKN